MSSCTSYLTTENKRITPIKHAIEGIRNIPGGGPEYQNPERLCVSKVAKKARKRNIPKPSNAI